MNWITDTIAIGNLLDAQDPELLRAESINSILGLTPTLRGCKAEDLGIRRLHLVLLEDEAPNPAEKLQEALTALRDLLQTAPPVLVHCRAGRSRSVAVVAAYFMDSQGVDADQALALIAAKRGIGVSPALERLLNERRPNGESMPTERS